MEKRERSWQDPKPQWRKKRILTKFDSPVPCPYCGDPQNTSLQLCQHVLTHHNWNKNYKPEEE
jgi:uncharacterized Zn-finger protein